MECKRFQRAQQVEGARATIFSRAFRCCCPFLVTKRRLCFFLSEAPVYVDADLYGVCVGGEVAYYEIILYII